MSSASVSYNFVNSTIADATQVSQNFTDLVDFINGQIPHSDGTGGAPDLRTVAFHRAVDYGNKLLSNSFSGTTNSDGHLTVTFPQAFAAAPDVVLVQGMSPVGGGNIFVSAVLIQKTASNFEIRILNQSGNPLNAIAVTGVYIAIG
jgi:hypothetical protein